MKTIKVVAAVIHNTTKNGLKIFATARGYGEFKGKWEFPGGKIESGETVQEALIREIKEELDVEVAVGELIDTVEYDYPTFHLSMYCFWCSVLNGEIILKEAERGRWLSMNALYSVDWLPADKMLIKKLKNSLLPCSTKPPFHRIARLLRCYRGKNETRKIVGWFYSKGKTCYRKTRGENAIEKNRYRQKNFLQMLNRNDWRMKLCGCHWNRWLICSKEISLQFQDI